MKKCASKVVVLMVLICTQSLAGWWYSGDDYNWEYQQVSSWTVATNTVALANPDVDIYWGGTINSFGPWIDFYWDGVIVWGWAINADTVTTPWHGEFTSFEEAYASAAAALSDNPDFAGVFSTTSLTVPKRGKGHKK